MVEETPSTRSRILRYALMIVIPLGLGLGGFFTYRAVSKEPPTVSVERRTLRETVDVSGSAQADRNVTLKSELAGRIVKRMVPENTFAKSGTVLLTLDTQQASLQLAQAERNAGASQDQAQAQIDSANRTLSEAQKRYRLNLDNLQNQIEKARSSMRFLESELTRNQALYREGAISRQIIDNQEQQLKQARLDFKTAQDNWDRTHRDQTEIVAARNLLAQSQTALANAQKQGAAAIALAQDALTRTTIKAPFDGTLTAWSIREGDVITPATPVGIFQDLRKIYLRLPIDEIDLPKMRVGGQVTIIFDAYPEKSFQGQIRLISRSSVLGDGNVQVFPVEVDFTDPSGLIKPGMSGDAIALIQERQNVISIPLAAVRREGEKFLVDRLVDGKPQKTEIQAGISTLEYLEVQSGLTTSDRLVVESLEALETKP